MDSVMEQRRRINLKGQRRIQKIILKPIILKQSCGDSKKNLDCSRELKREIQRFRVAAKGQKANKHRT